MEAEAGVDIQGILQVAEPVEQYIGEFLTRRSLPANLRDAIRYSALAPGKRLRPVLVVHSCLAVGGTVEQAMVPAGALELIHAFSLVHDDLPAMDDDDLRRGRPTLHKHTNEAMAILAGDAMMGLAFEWLCNSVQPGSTALALLRELTVGTNNMIAGQVYDTLPDFPDDVEPMQQLRTVHIHKTGALLRCACRMGGIVGGASEAQLHQLTRYAHAIGLMFQVVDDLLDVTASTEQLGKTAGKDEKQNKLTYPSLLGVEQTRAEVERLLQEALAGLEGFGESAGRLRDLAQYIAHRKK